MKKFSIFLTILSLVLGLQSFATAESFQCEVMTIVGTAQRTDSNGNKQTLKEGDLLQASDSIETATDSSIRISFDKDWKNVAQIGSEAKAKIRSVHPTKIDLKDGKLYAKLKALPKTSSFEVKTPTAVAAVRGSEYETAVQNGETQIFNYSSSKVQVFGVDASGKVSDAAVVLENNQKTQVNKAGEAPSAAEKMSADELSQGQEASKAVEKAIQTLESQGRVGRLPEVSEIEQKIQAAAAPATDDEPRVVDNRRRSFKAS